MSHRSWFSVQILYSISLLVIAGFFLLLPTLGFSDVEGSLRNIKSQLTGVILPVLSVIGLGIASVSFFTGNPNAKQHIVYAILGCGFGFGAQAIVDFIGSMVR